MPRRKGQTTTVTYERIQPSAPESVQASIVIVAGPHVGAVHYLEQSVMVLGRAEEADIVVEDPGLSRAHCRFVIEDSAATVEDLKSTNGTWVNYDRITKTSIKSGDRIRVGKATVLKFCFEFADGDDYQRDLYEAGVRDPLTGVYNKRYFDERLRAELAFTTRHGVATTILVFGIDDFEDLLVKHTLPAADTILQRLAQAVRESIRVEDLFARTADTEFAIVARGLRRPQAWEFGERLRKIISETEFLHKQSSIPVRISVGTSTAASKDAIDGDTLYQEAAEALAEAHQQGGNTVYPPLSVRKRRNTAPFQKAVKPPSSDDKS